MTHTRELRAAALCVALAQAACLGTIDPPPVFGPTYQGTGAPIFVKDSRTDWQITEGNAVITSEQALEATGDPEYASRRLAMQRYDDELYREARHHHVLAHVLEILGVGMIGAGGYDQLVPSTMPASTSIYRSYGGYATMLAGLVLFYYAQRRGSQSPPYVSWHTPAALDRPAYVRQVTESYNEKHGVTSTVDQPGSVENSPDVPGQRHIPRPRSRRGLPGAQ